MINKPSQLKQHDSNKTASDKYGAVHPEHTALVVECLARITDSMDQEAYIHIPVDETRKILMAGLTAEDTEIQGNAERARENLLRSRRFEFMDF